MHKLNGKKWTLVLLLLAAALFCTACGDGAQNASGIATTTEIPAILNQMEYTLYQNIFYNGYGSQYEGKEMTKQGIFTTVYDAFDEVNRYYVWGYLDNTRCCDWQWEIKLTDTKNLPADGSVVTVKGTFTASGDALDGYWIINPTVTALSQYVGEKADMNMYTMSDTLERVQVMNIVYVPDAFEGKTFNAYARIMSADTVQDPYYSGSWTIPFTAEGEIPAIGTTVLLKGQVKAGALASTSLTVLD